MTIREAAVKVLTEKGAPMTAKEIHEAIVDKGYYKFGAKNPISVLNGTIRQHCDGLSLKSAKEPKNFRLVDDKYGLR